MAKKKNSESVGSRNQTTDFIAPAAYYKNSLPGTKDGSSKETEITSPETDRAINKIPEKRAEKFQKIVEEHTPKIQDTPNPVQNRGGIEETEKVESVSSNSNTITSPVPIETIIHTKEPVVKKINIVAPIKRVSGLSISSLKAKKEHELKKIEVVIDQDDLPKESFTEQELQKHWANFIDDIDAKGQKILASNLHSDIPKLKDNHTICIELPNSTMKKEIERESFELMEYLREKLNNHFIELKITVNEESVKKFAFTPEEKYEKLREKNPAIDLLRKEFDLDL